MDLKHGAVQVVLEELFAAFPQHKAHLLAEAKVLDASTFSHRLVQSGVLNVQQGQALFQRLQDALRHNHPSTKTDIERPLKTPPSGPAALVFDPQQLQRFLTGSGRSKLNGQLFANKFLVIRERGRGGMGLVLEAENVQTKVRVALKLCLADDQSVEEIDRFRREAQVLAQLDHPHIIQVSEYGHDHGVPYYAMELLDGWTLRSEVNQALDGGASGLDWERAKECLAPIASALSYCHENGVVHRDVKPENVLIEKSTGRPVLIDFGIVKRDPQRLGETLDGLSRSLTEEGTVLGTPAFMSPEQLDSQHFGEISAAADVWGFSATLFYALTGVPPVPGQSLINIFNAVLSGNIREIRDFVPSIPSAVEKIFARSFTRDPDERITMDELEQFLNPAERSVPWLKVGAALIFLLTLALGFWLWPSQGELELKLDEPPKWTSKESLTISGLATRSALFEVRRDGESLYKSSSPERRWVLPVILGEGENRFDLSGRTEDSQVEKRWTLLIMRDSTPPSIQAQAPPKLLFGKDEFVILLDREGRGILEVEDNSSVTATLGGKTLKALDSGRFEFIREGEEKVEDLLLVDAAGGETRARIRWVSRESRAKRARAHEILSDWTLYENAALRDQDYIFERVGELLGENFKAVTPQVFRCGGKSFRLQTYRHELTRVFFRLIPGGLFTMGVRDVDYEFQRALRLDPQFRREWVSHASPACRVKVPPMLVGATELSHGQWLSIFEEEDLNQKNVDYAMAGLSWEAAQNWLKKAGDGFRLPSEAEWEYAARAGTRGRFFWGDEVDPRYLFCRPHARKRPSKVTGRVKYPNAFGLSDTLGNLWEFCEDSYVDNYSEQPLNGAPQRRKHALITRRGGCFSYLASDCQVWTRSLGHKKNLKNSGNGMRVFVTVPGFERSK